MRITSVRISNFKGLQDADIPLQRTTILVGTNSSGKSSVLQAVHFSARCLANPSIQRNQTRSILPTSLDYYPTLDAKRVGHIQDLRQQRKHNPEVATDVVYCVDTTSGSQTATIKIARGNNDTVSITPSVVDDELYNAMKSTTSPFSAYIPGLAGIPLEEEKRSRLPVFRQAASGDANTVLRNILHLISESTNDDINLKDLEDWTSRVLGPTSIRVHFNEVEHFRLYAEARTAEMPADRWAPLELMGTGVLQVIQIFAYLVLFRPKLLLIDEPDSHLHPDRQEQLINVIESAAAHFSTQIILTTHSPHIVRAASLNSGLVWLKEGTVPEQDDRTVRGQMGWGLLDKSAVIVTEDRDTRLLRNILKQWPDIESKVAIYPVRGATTLPKPDGLLELRKLLGDKVSLIVHRDSDFMTEAERAVWAKPYTMRGFNTWITSGSDVEAYFCTPEYISASLSIDNVSANTLLLEAVDQITNMRTVFEQKRHEINKDTSIYPYGGGTPTHEAAALDLGGWGVPTCKGKQLLSSIRQLAQERGLPPSQVGMPPPPDVTLADELRNLLKNIV